MSRAMRHSLRFAGLPASQLPKGDPAECVDKIHQLHEKSGGSSASSRSRGLLRRRLGHESLRLLMEEVAPRVAHLN